MAQQFFVFEAPSRLVPLALATRPFTPAQPVERNSAKKWLTSLVGTSNLKRFP